jgi:aminoglycoside 6'-N-acetyltransferase
MLEIPVLQGEKVLLRAAVEDDRGPFMSMLSEPSVSRWWGAPDPDFFEKEVLGAQACTLAVVADGAVAGLVQFNEENEPDYRHASMDIALGPAFHGRGVGSDALRTLARYLFNERGHHRITIDPALDNLVAIRCYKAVGFQPVEVMRGYERSADGGWHDNLLMDLLAGELLPPSTAPAEPSGGVEPSGGGEAGAHNPSDPPVSPTQ